MQRSTRAVIGLVTVVGICLGVVPAAADSGLASGPLTTAWADEPADAGEPNERDGRDVLPPHTPGASGADYSSDQVLVRFDDGATASQQRSALSAAGTVAAQPVEGTDFVVVPTGGADPVALVAQLEADPRIAEAQLDHTREIAGWTNDPMLEWAQWYFDLMRLPRAWDVATGQGIVIAVLDTGVNASHPDLSGAVLPGYDFVNDDDNAADDNGHGTAVAGTAAARGNNGIGSVGSAWHASILPVKVLDAAGNGDDSSVAAGINYAVAQNADVINISLGGTAASPVLLAAMENAVAQGSVVVAAAGNDGSNVPFYPAAYAPEVDGVLAVSATDDWGRLTEFSSWGDWVSVAAPGLQIGVPVTGGYTWASGTSFSAPFVSGVAALLMDDGTTNPAQVENAIVSNARDAGPRGIDPFYGRGVVDAAAALGLGASLPLDRAPGDPTAEDGLPAFARPLTTAKATLSPEGDADWYSYTVSTGGVYEVTATVVDVIDDGTGALKPEITVLDTEGYIIGQGKAEESNENVSVPVVAGDGQQLLIGISNVNGSASDARYTVDVSSGPRVSFAIDTIVQDVSRVRSVVADVTGDGIPDLVTAVAHATTLDLYVGAGDGTFAAPTTVAIGATQHSNPALVAFDADGDGDADLAVGTTTGFQVLKQTAGVLTSYNSVAYGGGVMLFRAADMDGDGDLDLVATRSTSGARTSVLVNNGTGAFTEGALVAAVFLPTFDVADVSADGRPDVVTGDGSLYHQQAGGTFAAPSALPGGGSNVVLGDITGDGITDVVRAPSGYPQDLIVTPGTAGGYYSTPVMYPAGMNPGPLAIADIDGDGRNDVVVGNVGYGRISVLFQKADGTLSAPEETTGIQGSSSFDMQGMVVSDVDTDGARDVVISGSLRLSVLLQERLIEGMAESDWVRSGGPGPHASGVGVRPTIEMELWRTPADGAITDQTVRLIDGLAAVDVAAVRDYTGASGVLSITPTVDLVPGRHYAVLVSGLTAVDSTVQPESYWTWFTVGAAGQRFTPLEPWRVMDTRSGPGAGRVVPGYPVTLDFSGAIPDAATAVVLNVTAAGPQGTGNIRVYPTPTGANTPPLISNLNVISGVDQPNLVTVSLGSGSRVSFATDGTSSHVIADIAGYYSEGGSTAFVPLSPVRVMDTRSGKGGVPKAEVRAGRWVDLVVTGRNGVPIDASAVVLNVTGVSPASITNVRVYPTPAASESQSPPTVSNLNLIAGRDQPNLVTVGVGDGGKVRFYTQSSSLHLVADLAGYYSPTGDNGFVPLTPVRVADSRTGRGFPKGTLTAGASQPLTIGGTRGVPMTASAVVLNVTAVNPSWLSNVRVFPTPATPSVPLVSNLNVIPGRDEPNLVIVRLGDSGGVSFYSQTANLHMVVDLGGYFIRYVPER